ncbi:MAG: hypothetical protein ACE5FF_17130, partial [Saprospiraceae bacterium]
MNFIHLKSTLFYLTTVCLLLSCSKDSNNLPAPPPGGGGGNNTNGWLIPQGEVFDGGPGKDGIPSVDS